MIDRLNESLPREFEEYRLVRPLGRGQMGQVFLAHDALLDRAVAIKFLAVLRPDEGMRRRFFTEARAIARLQHPGVVSVHRVGEVRGCPYLVSEFVRGRSLDALPRPLPWPEVARIGAGLARALAAAHRQGVLHRDVKPANVMLADTGEVKLLDFGLAKLLDDHARAGEPLPRSNLAETTLPGTGAAVRVATVEEPALDVPSYRTGETADASAPGLLGTPLYLAPERWRGEPATRQSDLYALGVVLFELASGNAPHGGVDLATLRDRVLGGAPPKLDGAGIDARFAALVEACLAPDPAARPRSADDFAMALESLSVRPGAPPVHGAAPYRGLAPFEADHRAQFFGRDADLQAVRDRLSAQPFVLLLGDSGVGKSSLARAGILPALAAATLAPGDKPWRTLSFVPGRAPVRALAAALAPVLGREVAALAWLISEEPTTLAREAQRLAAERGFRLAIFADQLEELVTLAPAREASATAEALAALIERAPAVRLLATARSDLLTRLLALPGLGSAAVEALYPLRPLGPAALREAIVRPARAAGYEYESDAMVDTLVASTERAPGGLPLLQFALTELWGERDEERRIIPVRALARMGGVEGALGAHAERAIAALTPAEQARARDIFTRLVTADGTRARRTRAELIPDDEPGRRALEALVKGRLVVAGDARDSGATGGAGAYEIAHEALVRSWPRLAEWLSSDGDARATRERLARAATEWERLGRAPEALLGARQLAEVERLAPGELPPASAALVTASRRTLRRARAARMATILAVPVLVMALLAASVLRRELARRSSVRGHVAAATRSLADGRSARDEADTGRPAMDRAFDHGDTAIAEQRWAAVRDKLLRADQLFVRATGGFEAALALDAEDANARTGLIDALFERVRLATGQGRHAEAEELEARLGVLLAAPGAPRGHAAKLGTTLNLTTVPADAEVVLERYDVAPDARFTLIESRRLARTSGVDLAAGSYVLDVRAPDRAQVRHAFVVEVGRPALAVTLALPGAGALPAGFIYVPAGPFKFGSAGEETTRRSFLRTTPLREVTTAAYLIAKDEVTYADWIAFLTALPPDERRRRTPRTGLSFTGQVALERPSDTGPHRLTIVLPSGQRLEASEGQPIAVPGRTQRARQDWRRFPVAGISPDDASAFAAWSARTGRVPRARLCTEYEWERAARGADGRIFPHGNALEPDEANFDLTYEAEGANHMGPDEVGSHPASRSPFGLDDTAGNVWEIVTSSIGPPTVLVRGGSYHQALLTLWLPNRQTIERGNRDATTGVRLCADP